MQNKFLNFILFLSFFFFVNEVENKLYAQNLVKNPSFENYIKCPSTTLPIDSSVIDWEFKFGGSFYNACSSFYDSVPLNECGYQLAHTGKGYASILVYYYNFNNPSWRGYLEGHFLTELKKNSFYCISYYVSNRDKCSDAAIKNVDANISDTLLYYNNGSQFNLKNINPQIKSPQILTDSVGWTMVSGIYKAHGGEKYITIGNFLSDNETTFISYNSPNPGQASYYIDDVNVSPINLTAPNIGKDTVVCKNALPYMLHAPVGYDTYLWSNGCTTESLAVTIPGKYYVTCGVTGCGTINSNAVNISLRNSPVLNLGNDTMLCKGKSIVLKAQLGFTSYLWNTKALSQNITVKNSGWYSLKATDVCSIQLDSVYVKIDSLPNLHINLGSDTTLCKDDINIPLTLVCNVPLPHYYWNTGDTTSSIIVTEKGVYMLSNKYTCGTLSGSINVKECIPIVPYSFYAPDCFTPNNDGLNDFFEPKYFNITVQDFKILDRLGDVLYDDKNTCSWDGKYKNKECPQGVYIFRIVYTNPINTIVLEKFGKIVLMR